MWQKRLSCGQRYFEARKQICLPMDSTFKYLTTELLKSSGEFNRGPNFSGSDFHPVSISVILKKPRGLIC